ncbi:Glycoside hydrolase, 38 vacuolar alpha mannosidase, partial [Linderina macrospora]
MDEYPEYKFAASQAQQFEWLKQNYPGLFARIQDKAKTGQFIPIGATWVEMDCNLPSGESLARQFLLGQQFYQEHFNETCKVFWLPDTFGYSSQLPQIVRLAGAKYFFTQKLSWNNINKFPNTTFRWVGLDGSHVLTHMAPSNTYGAQCNPGELIDSEHNHKDIVYSNESLLLYGNGDGGGGPLKAMLERLRRMNDMDGLPKVKNAHPNEFYEHVEKTATELVAWKGELYFELHRGTYTSQSNNKRNNRQAEFLMRDVELLNTVAKSLSFGLYEYPMEAIRSLWKQVCLNQFHDVLPGSAIGMVYRDSDQIYREIFTTGDALRKRALDFLYGDVIAKAPEDMSAVLLVNTAAWMRTEIIAVPELPLSLINKAGANVQIRRKDGAPLVLATNICGNRAQLLDLTLTAELHSTPVKAYQCGDNFVLENVMVKVTIGQDGRIKSF